MLRHRGESHKDGRLWHRPGPLCLPGQPMLSPQATIVSLTRSIHTVCQTSLHPKGAKRLYKQKRGKGHDIWNQSFDASILFFTLHGQLYGKNNKFTAVADVTVTRVYIQVYSENKY